jgi:uncharacterized protein YgiB involved in biofilm formation
MGTAPLLLTACGHGQQVSQQDFASIDSCTDAGVPLATCQKAHDDAVANAQKNAPHYLTRDQCVATYGQDMCEQTSNTTEGSFWVPMMAGFLISRMLNGGPSMYYPAGPVFLQSNGNYYSPTAGVYSGSYASSTSGWRTVSAGSGGAGGSRAITASRGGFGSSSAAAGSWGG